jgi:hypothetical protein
MGGHWTPFCLTFFSPQKEEAEVVADGFWAGSGHFQSRLTGPQGAHGIGWWCFQERLQQPWRKQTWCLLQAEQGWGRMGRYSLPSVPQAESVFLGVPGRKYPCYPASFFLRQVGREWVRSGATRPLGDGFLGGFTLVLERRKSDRLALSMQHCQWMTLVHHALGLWLTHTHWWLAHKALYMPGLALALLWPHEVGMYGFPHVMAEETKVQVR